MDFSYHKRKRSDEQCREEELFQCTATVMEIENSQSIILTSASLLRSFTVENSVAENIKIIVYLPEKSSIPGQVEAFDLHFNVAAIRIDKQLPVASFTHVNDGISIDLDELHSSQSQLEMSLHPHRSRSFDLIPGEPVIALGRFSKEPYQFMVAPREFWQPRHPLLGMETTNLYAADLYFLGRIIQKFPGVVKGVLVKEVFQDSPVESAGLKSKDVIVQFGGKKVQSFLELYESMWHKVGETVALTVARQSDGFADLEMVVEEVASDDLYSFFLAYGVCFRVSIGPAEIQMDHKWVGLMSAPWLTLLATI